MNKQWMLFVSCALGCIASHAQFADTLPVVHDPVIIRQDSTYYIFCTGWGISVFSSTDMKHWRRQSPIFSKAPDWAVAAIPGFKGNIWAPDISYHNGQYYIVLCNIGFW